MSSLPPYYQNRNFASPIVDSENEVFRQYLETSGILEVMTRIFQDMFKLKNKPSDPLAYFIRSLEAISFDAREIAALKHEIQDLKSKINKLEIEKKVLRLNLSSQVSQLENLNEADSFPAIEIAALKDEIQNLKSEIDKLENEKKDLSEELEKLKD